MKQHESWGFDGSLERLPSFTPILPAALPAHFRRLLDHETSMTATLTTHWKAEIVACILRQQLGADGAALVRQVVLVTNPGHLPVEIAEIRIDSTRLDERVIRQLATTSAPFGQLLRMEGIAFRTEPVSFFRVGADGMLARSGQVAPETPLYGRTSRLWRGDGCLIGEAVEILPRA
jgi:chorismate-pyruvate lyase